MPGGPDGGVEIADIARFTEAALLHANAGVIPPAHSSGDRTHHGKIVRAGESPVASGGRKTPKISQTSAWSKM
ncbi:MAG: transposase [Candidatus Aminicenantes bacterium]|nr:transposase [Candidatus Aminicenantes bacterium]